MLLKHRTMPHTQDDAPQAQDDAPNTGRIFQIMYRKVVHLQYKRAVMELSVNKFRANLKTFVDKAIEEHSVIRVTRRAGKDFVVMSADDWEREMETLYVLRNQSLMNQVAESLKSYASNTGYRPTNKQIDEINRV